MFQLSITNNFNSYNNCLDSLFNQELSSYAQKPASDEPRDISWKLKT